MTTTGVLGTAASRLGSFTLGAGQAADSGSVALTGAGSVTIAATAVVPAAGGGGLPIGAARITGRATRKRPLPAPIPVPERYTVSLHLTGGGHTAVFGQAGGGYDDELALEWLLLEAA